MKRTLLLSALVLILLGWNPAIRGADPVSIPLAGKAGKTPFASEWKKSEAFGSNALHLQVRSGVSNELVLVTEADRTDWSVPKYVVMEVFNESPYSALLNVRFFRKGNLSDQGAERQGETASAQSPRLTCVIGVMPLLKTKVIFPLSYLDAQEIFLPRYPRQMKGTLSGRRIDLQEIGKFSVAISPVSSPLFETKIQIASVTLTESLPLPYEAPARPVVDEFGQWTARDWPGKVHSSLELKTSINATKALSKKGKYPQEWSQYGGWKELAFEKTGFFRTHHDGKRWWLVDPDGYAFLSAGVDCINANASGVLGNQEELFSTLPPREGIFAQAYGNSRGLTMIDFLPANLMRIWGDKWREEWESVTAGLMKAWRVNTVANWSDIAFARKAKVPYVLNMNGFPTTSVKLYRDFPDVFDPAYQQASTRFAAQLANYRDDPYLMGYFLQNEPHWAFGDNDIAFEMLATPFEAHSKRAFAAWLEKKYGSLQKLNEAWNYTLSGFGQLEKIALREYPSEAAKADCREFSGVLVDRYVEQVCTEVKKADPNHLNLGMRYAWISSELCYRAGAWFDVFSINGYSNPAPPATDEVARRSGKPVLIGEWHFGSAMDRGLPATGIQGAASQKERATAYRYYFEQGVARPEIIGVHWFQWNDQPIFGRFDGENYNIGFLDICFRPYPELTQAAQLSHERMYRVASGLEKPFSEVIAKSPQIYY